MKTIKQLLSMLDHFLFPKPTCEEKAVIDRINLGMGICLASLTLLVSLYIPVWSVMTEQKDAIEIIGLVLIQITSILFLLYAWSRWKNRSIATKIPMGVVLYTYQISLLVFEIIHSVMRAFDHGSVLDFVLMFLICFMFFIVPAWINAILSGVALLYIDHTLYTYGMDFGSIRTSVNIFLVIVFISLVRYWAMTEVARRSVEHMKWAQEQQRLSNQLDRSMHAFKKMAETDALTQLYSRNGFVTRVQKQLETNPEKAMTLVFIDIDDFKQINDLYGHNIGDVALTSVANNIRHHFKSDAIVGRSGGDELCIVLPGTAKENEKEIHYLHKVKQYFEANGQKHCCTLSAGYADYPKQANDISELLKKADTALYNVKLHGKNGIAYYDYPMDQQFRSQIGFSDRELIQNMPIASMIHTLDRDQKILYVNMAWIEVFECSGVDDFLQMTQSSVQNMILPSERAVFQIDYEQILANKKVNGKKYHILTKNGQQKLVLVQRRRFQTQRYRNLMFVTLMEIEESRG